MSESICFDLVYHHFDFTNEADDGGGFRTFSAMVHSREDGTFDEVHLTEQNTVDLISATSESKTHDSGIVRLERSFYASAWAELRVSLGHWVMLWAQDGLVEALGTIGVQRPDCMPGACQPYLQYVIVPV